jgi:DNA-binding transcriptional regulator YhcF (GntR family)
MRPGGLSKGKPRILRSSGSLSSLAADMLRAVSLDANNRRNLFRAVIDDLEEQIRTGKLRGGDVLPTANKLAEHYGMASMTVQRALRDMQERGLTYAVVGKGTYIHPEAAQRLNLEDSVGQDEALELNPPISDRDLSRRMAQYILKTNEISARLTHAIEAKDGEATQQALDDLEAHKLANIQLSKDIDRFVFYEIPPDPDEAKPAKRTGRPRKTTK